MRKILPSYVRGRGTTCTVVPVLTFLYTYRPVSFTVVGSRDHIWSVVVRTSRAENTKKTITGNRTKSAQPKSLFATTTHDSRQCLAALFED
jgi:hypothetical protein